MTIEQKLLVQESFSHILPIAETAALLFYERLFDLDPKLRPLFKDDMREQRRMLMSMLRIAVAGLDNLEKLTPGLQNLGQRHVSYGVRAEDYETVGAALLWALEQGLGSLFTPEVRAAWTAVYTILATTMQDGAQKFIAA